ncbi:MAG: outer membrane beta-barrel protein [Gillisia sp.]
MEAGPQFGFLTSSEVDVLMEGGGNVNDYLSNFEYGVNFGLGLKWVNGFFFQGRYNLGLANIFDDLKIGFNDDDYKKTNRVIQFSLGYMY